MKYFFMIWLFVVVAFVALMGPRGGTSRKPPVYLFPDMDIQAKNKAQSENVIFDDASTDRQPAAGSVGRGYAWDTKTVFGSDYRYDVAENPELHTAKLPNGEWVDTFPMAVDERFIQLGKEKYDIFCTVCHGRLGNGKGVLAADGSDYTMNRGYFGNVADLTAQTYVDYPHGQLWDRITNGWNTMYPYKDKLTPQERWAVVAYLRALQLSANGTVDDVPQNKLSDLGL